MKRLANCRFYLLFMIMLGGYAKTLALTPTFKIGSVANVTTSTIVIPVTSSNFIELLGWQGSINWDNSKLNYVGVTATIAQLNGIQFSASVTSNTGRLSFIWVDNNLMPQSIANNAVLFNITFNVINTATGTTNVVFSNNSTPLLVSNANGSAVNPVDYLNGTVSFPTPYIAPEFIIASANNVGGSTLNVPITCKNFAQLLAWQGSVNWDNSKLTYSSISAINSQLSGIQFSATVSASTGRLSFTWTENNLLPQSIPDSTVLFIINYNIAGGTTGSTDIIFGNTPTPLLVSDANSNPVNNVVYTKGTIYFAGATIPPQFIIGSVYNLSTSTLIVPITAVNFIQLLGWQGSMNWDNTRLVFSSISTVVAQLNGMQFNASVSGSTGRISFLWTDQNLIPQTIPNNTVLFYITFSIAGGYSGITYIDFTNFPTPLLVLNSSSSAMPGVIYTRGVITFTQNICPGVGNSSSITSNISGISYQWQLDTGSGYNNITDNSSYAGSNSPTLGLSNLPSSSSGYKFRCAVNGLYSNVYVLRFKDYWIGGSGSAWENSANWSCTQIPDANTEVILNGGAVIINSNVTINSLSLTSGATLTVTTGNTLIIKH